MRRITAVVAALAAALAGQAVPAGAETEGCPSTGLAQGFCDHFEGAELAESWEADTNNGTIKVADSWVHLEAGHGPTFPYVRQDGVFPAEGPFELSVRFQYQNDHKHGTSFIASTGLPTNGQIHTFDKLVTSHQGGGKRFLQTPCGQRTWAADTEPHTLVVSYAADGSARFVLDDIEELACSAAPRPTGVYLGVSGNTGANFDWTDVSFDFVRIEPLCDETGPVSGPVDTLIEPNAGDASDLVHEINCGVVVPNGL